MPSGLPFGKVRQGPFRLYFKNLRPRQAWNARAGRTAPALQRPPSVRQGAVEMPALPAPVDSSWTASARLLRHLAYTGPRPDHRRLGQRRRQPPSGAPTTVVHRSLDNLRLPTFPPRRRLLRPPLCSRPPAFGAPCGASRPDGWALPGTLGLAIGPAVEHGRSGPPPEHPSLLVRTRAGTSRRRTNRGGAARPPQPLGLRVGALRSYL